MPGLFDRARIVAPPGFNRWRVPPASVAIHLCIGSVYAWSLFNPALIRVEGVVASAADDWTLKQVTGVFSVAIVFLGLSAALAGRWLEKVGPRVVGTVSACCWGGGFLIGAAGIHTHRLWLLYLGYGVVGGCGLGLGYVSPVSTLLKWFPDRRGMAAGLAIMGFGGGALVATPLKKALLRAFYQPPTYLGSLSDVALTTQGGQRFATLDGRLREAVVVGANDVAGMIVPGPEGVYLAGTGRVGIAETFVVLGVLYFVVMLVAAFSYRLPAADWKPAGWTPPPPAGLVSRHTVGVNEALKTPQFYLLWIVLCFNVTAGIGVLGVAETMMRDIFGGVRPDVVTGGFAATFVLMMSVFNMLGRFFWASASDYLGRKRTYTLFFTFGIVLYLTIPWCARRASGAAPLLWLTVFYVVMMLIFTMYGGGFATIPAYLADLFGTRYVGGIHGRLLTAWSTAGVLGPLTLTSLRQSAVTRAIHELADQVEPARFEARFGAPPTELGTLIERKTVTIARLMEIAPPGTVDPTTTVYNSTMVLMAALLGVALVANLLVRPVAARHHLTEAGQ